MVVIPLSPEDVAIGIDKLSLTMFLTTDPVAYVAISLGIGKCAFTVSPVIFPVALITFTIYVNETVEDIFVKK